MLSEPAGHREDALVGGPDFPGAGDADMRIVDEAVADGIGPAVNGEFLAAIPGIANDGAMADVDDLLDDVQFGEAIGAAIFGEGFEVAGMFQADILDVPQPIVGQSHAPLVERRRDPGATVVADDEDMFHLQMIDGELNDGHAIQVAVDDDVGDVAMDKEFARGQADDLIRWDAAISATDPHVLGILPGREFGKQSRILLLNLVGPVSVVLDEMREVAHGAEIVTKKARVGRRDVWRSGKRFLGLGG